MLKLKLHDNRSLCDIVTREQDELICIVLLLCKKLHNDDQLRFLQCNVTLYKKSFFYSGSILFVQFFFLSKHKMEITALCSYFFYPLNF